MLGYRGQKEETEHAIQDHWSAYKTLPDSGENNFRLHTGDIGYYDDGGNLFIVDRLKELIKVALMISL